MGENINVEVLKTLYNQEKEKLKELKEMLDNALSKKQTEDTLFNEIKIKMSDLECNIKKIENDFDELLYKKTFKPAVYCLILLSIILTIMALLAMVLVMVGSPIFIINVLKIPIYNNTKGILLLLGLWGGGILGIAQFVNKVFPKVYECLSRKLEDYLTSKIERTSVYKELKLLHEASLELLEREKKAYEPMEVSKNKAVDNYSIIKEEYDEKKRLVDYLDRQINPTEMTTKLSRELRNDINQ